MLRKSPNPANADSAGRRASVSVVLAVGCAALTLLAVLAVSLGPLRIPILDVWQIFALKLGVLDAGDLTTRDINVVWMLRVPRVIMGAMVGAALAISGAALQSLFNNPLADPGIVGVTSGASVGAVGAIVLSAAFENTWLFQKLGTQWMVPMGAFLAGLAITLLVYALARPKRNRGTARMLLVGIALGSSCQAVVGFFTYIANDSELQTLVFWQMGSLSKVTWLQVTVVLPVFLVGVTCMAFLSRALDVLTLGERQAQHLGLNVAKARLLVILATAMLTAAAVAFAGSIGFVGLVVPHILRFIVGPLHRSLLPASAIAGAALLVAADTASRIIAPPTEIPIGLFTALVGAPFFLFLVLREKRGTW
ncbi:iron ABC transporter permease [Corynebacterium sp. H128]|uniref:FecCD family ABC transporter permease n=1 Tax=Corynebacterium sp. H128 TaxID=3133427 RepID=UPI0030A73EF4